MESRTAVDLDPDRTGVGAISGRRFVSPGLQDQAREIRRGRSLRRVSRDLYAAQGAIEAVKRDPRLKEFPVGVLFALDVHSASDVGRDPTTRAPRFDVTPQGRLRRSKDERTLHLMEKVQPGFGSQNWAFGGFDPVTTEPLKLQLPGDCHLCHQAAVMSDMTFSMTLLKRFVTSGTVQYRLCQQPGRQPCPFQ